MATRALNEVDVLRDAVATAAAVVAVGARTHWEVGGAPPTGCVEVGAPAGVLGYDPAELTVTVSAGTTVGDLDALLAESGQECVLDPRDSARATVGGTIAAGLSGPRRLRYGPIRDRVLEVRFVTADGRLVKGGGPTVKNVSGFDLPRLLVGSLGTIGVITQVTLRCQPQPPVSLWARAGTGDPLAVRRRCSRPSSIAWDGESALVLLEGHPDDVAAEMDAGGLTPSDVPPAWPDGPHRGRISVRPRRLAPLRAALDDVGGLRWIAEVGVGTVHVAADDSAALAAGREAAHDMGGWLLREAGGEAGGDALDGFGRALPNQPIMARLKAAFDPTGKLSPGRLDL
ncbi:MAG: FAD-binding oxidoreductase [Acidimicrobiia bacterium]